MASSFAWNASSGASGSVVTELDLLHVHEAVAVAEPFLEPLVDQPGTGRGVVAAIADEDVRHGCRMGDGLSPRAAHVCETLDWPDRMVKALFRPGSRSLLDSKK